MDDFNITIERTDTFDQYTVAELKTFLKKSNKRLAILRKKKIDLLYSLKQTMDLVDDAAKNETLGRLPIESLHELCAFERRKDVISSLEKMGDNLAKDKLVAFDEFEVINLELRITELAVIQCKAEMILRSL